MNAVSSNRKKRKNNLNKLFTGKSFLGRKSHWTIVSLDDCVIGQLSPWTIAPWTIVATPGIVLPCFTPVYCKTGQDDYISGDVQKTPA